ncbi:MAG: hypothetical protein IJC21_06255 [Lentisphaeria bacterium]|nr:hypothetical protein [Lentisphaeria bacterium]MBR7119030.1 hypothetical protein [Lentisphaeria bacterium]
MNNNIIFPPESEFVKLLADAQTILENKWRNAQKDVSTMSPEEFENQVSEALDAAAKGTSFESTIELVTGHRFPDIEVMNHFGVEVKSTKSDHWKTLGNSVLESTRKKEIEIIYIFFAQLLKNPKLKFRKYQDCLSEVQITHSPRYMIDMDLPPGQSIFDKMGLDYDTVRSQERPISLFIDYYKRILGNDTSVWWINNDGSEKSAPMQISFWSDLSTDKKHALMGYLLFLFPEVFSERSTTKYKRLIIWLVKNHSIVSACMRDDFSAGGRIELDIYGQKISLPQIINCLLKHIDSFRQAIEECSIDDVNEHLNPPEDFKDSPDARFELWFTQFCNIITKTSYNSEKLRKYIKAQLWSGK